MLEKIEQEEQSVAAIITQSLEKLKSSDSAQLPEVLRLLEEAQTRLASECDNAGESS